MKNILLAIATVAISLCLLLPEDREPKVISHGAVGGTNLSVLETREIAPPATGGPAPVGPSNSVGQLSTSVGPPSFPIWLSEEVSSKVQIPEPRAVNLKIDINDPLTTSSEYVYHLSFSWTVSYNVRSVSPGLGPHCFTVYGVARNGDSVIEMFELTPVEGSYFMPVPSLGPALSIPMSIAGGGVFLPPTERDDFGPPLRVELYRGPGLGADLVLANDPYRRYTYAVSRSAAQFWYIPWDEDLVPTQYLLGSDQALLHDVSSMRVQRHVSEGDKLRVWRRNRQTGIDSFLLLSDYDSDGLFDAHEHIVSRAMYKAVGYPGLWEKDYVNTVPWMSPR